MKEPDLTPRQRARNERVANFLRAKQGEIDAEREAEGHDDESNDRAPVVPLVAWEDPIPLGRSGTKPTPFPLHALPEWLARYVQQVAHATQTPPDMCAMLVLSVLAGAAGGHAVVEVRAGWREPLNLFVAVAMPPGARKTPVFQRVTEPLVNVETAMATASRPEILDTQVRRQAARDVADKAAMEAARASEDAREEAINYAKAMREMAEAIDVPVVPRLFADDVTPEALASLLAEQGGRMAIYSDEGGVFPMMAGRYSGAPNLEVYLKGHAGSPLRVDRKGRPAEYVRAPALTMGLTIQPAVLTALRTIEGGRGRGLLARFLWVVPANTVGGRIVAPEPVEPEVAERYAEVVAALTAALAAWDDPAVLVFAPGADMAVRALEEALEPRMHPRDGDLTHMADWVAKLAGHAARIAGLLHLVENPTDWDRRTVTAETAMRARFLAEYLLVHADEAFAVMDADRLVADARYVLSRLEGIDTISRRDIHHRCQHRFAQVGELLPVLDLLEDHGYLRKAPQKATTGRGRKPSPRYEVHPRVAESHTDIQ